MIVNCFNAFRVINIRFNEGVKYANHASIARVAAAVAETYEMSTESASDTWLALVQGGSGALASPLFTMAEARLIDTIISWWEAELGDEYEDGWGIKSRATTHFVFENHNRAIGVVLTRSARMG